jgi:hypothetical protein
VLTNNSGGMRGKLEGKTATYRLTMLPLPMTKIMIMTLCKPAKRRVLQQLSLLQYYLILFSFGHRKLFKSVKNLIYLLAPIPSE